MSRVRVLVIDGQGGGLGRQLTAALAAGCPDIELTAVGTNSIAASAMLKAGAHRAATGENAVVVNCRRADIIVGPIGIVIADSLLGEITPAMAAAVCAGVYGDYRQAAAAMVHLADTVSPDRRRTDIYREKYARYREWMTNREDRRHGGESEAEGV